MSSRRIFIHPQSQINFPFFLTNLQRKEKLIDNESNKNDDDTGEELSDSRVDEIDNELFNARLKGRAKNVIESNSKFNQGEYFLDDQEDRDKKLEDEDEEDIREEHDDNDKNSEQEEVYEEDVDQELDQETDPEAFENADYLDSLNNKNKKLRYNPTGQHRIRQNQEPPLLEENIHPTKNLKNSSSLLIDPNYKWLLKDLNLSDDKRVIDVTSLIEENESKMNSSSNEQNDLTKQNSIDEQQQEEKQLESNCSTDALPFLNDESEGDEFKNDHNFISELYEKLISSDDKKNKQTSENRNDVSNVTNEQNKTNISNENSESEEENDDEEEEEEEEEEDVDLGNQTTNDMDNVYKEWSKVYRSKNPNYTNADCVVGDEISDSNLKIKLENQLESKELNNQKNQQFSKSFEVSLDELDNMIDRVDSGIKLKRSKHESAKVKNSDEEKNSLFSSSATSQSSEKVDKINRENNSVQATAEAASKTSNIINTLKQEWSIMFNKLEKDYKSKLDEQQFKNEQRLKELHEEIKQSIQLQQQHQLQKQSISTISDDQKSKNENELVLQQVASTSSENSKYIIELKSKHSRHMQDLKDYYEKEIDELRKKVNNYEIKLRDATTPNNISMNNNKNFSLEIEESSLGLKQKLANSNATQLALNNELKNSNNALVNKLYESNEHIRYLTEENCELSNKLKEIEQELKHSNEKISNLEDCCNQLELQLTDTIKLQDQYIRELHVEKRNLVKKMQECEELKMNCKFYEQKCDSYERKLEDRDSIITRLKTQLIQTETDITRLEYEYKKAINSNKYLSCKQINLTEEPKSSKQQDVFNSKQLGHELPIKNVQQYSTINMNKNKIASNSTNNLVISTASPSSSSSLSPASPPTDFILTENQNNNKNNDYSKSNTAIILPVENRSKSPPLNKASNRQYNKRYSYHNDLNSMVNPRFNYAQTNELNPANQQKQSNLTSSSLYHLNDLNLPLHQLQQSRRDYANNSSICEQNYQQKQQQDQEQSNTSVSPTRRYLEKDGVYIDNSDLDQEITSSFTIKYTNHQQYENYSPTNQKNAKNTMQIINNSPNMNSNNCGFKLEPEKQIKYIEHLENEFDNLMRHKLQLDAQLTRLPYKSTNTSMYAVRQSVENELNMVEKKLASVKLELRKLNIIKTH